jgi:hypothetical protein
MKGISLHFKGTRAACKTGKPCRKAFASSFPRFTAGNHFHFRILTSGKEVKSKPLPRQYLESTAVFFSHHGLSKKILAKAEAWIDTSQQ